MGSIYTHISNFIDTWEGWFNVINGLVKLINPDQVSLSSTLSSTLLS